MMSIQHMDDFSMYGSNPAFLLNGVYADAVNCLLSADPNGTGEIVLQQNQGGGGGALTYPLQSGPIGTVGVAFRVWCAGLPTSINAAIGLDFRDAGNSSLFQLAIQPNGAINIVQNAPGTVIETSGVPVVTANAWWHIEIKETTGAGTGAIEVRVEGQTVITATGLALGATNVGIVGFGHPFGAGAGTAAYFKDIVIWDTSGAHNNDFLGSVLVTSLIPNADINTNWNLTGAASRFAALANSPPLDATQYITAVNPPPAAYVAGLTDLNADVTSVRAIMSMIRATKTDGGDASLQAGIISSPAAAPATVLGANRPITVAETYWRDIFETDPKTGASWLPGAVNLAQLQINRTV